MKSTAAFTSSSVKDVPPPRAGIMPLEPVYPSIACLYSVSLPWAMRGPQSALSPGLGAPATPAPWHRAQVFPYTLLPTEFSATGAAAGAAAGAGAATGAGAGAGAGAAAGAADGAAASVDFLSPQAPSAKERAASATKPDSFFMGIFLYSRSIKRRTEKAPGKARKALSAPRQCQGAPSSHFARHPIPTQPCRNDTPGEHHKNKKDAMHGGQRPHYRPTGLTSALLSAVNM